MESEAFLSKLADILEVDQGELNDTFSLERENWDSVAHLGVIAAIDEVYGVTVPTNEMRQCQSVGALLELVGRYAQADDV